MIRLHVALLAAVAVMGFDATAFAADMPTKASIAKPVAYDWGGFYLGGYYGAAVSDTRVTTSVTRGTQQVNSGGIGGGLTVGYNWQPTPYWLVGLEGDVGYLGIHRNEKDWDDTVFAGTTADWYGTARARVGYVTGPSVIYGTGGAAFVHMGENFGGNLIFGPLNAPPTEASTTKVGWTAGGGIETKLTNHWSAKTEYLYVDAGNNSFAANVFGVTQTATFTNRFHVIKSGLNYQFGGSGPNEGFFAMFGAPPLPSDHNWSGFYVGGNLGLGISNTHGPGGEGAVPFGTETDQNATGFTAGAHVGYNYLIARRWLVGVEGDIGGLALTSNTPEWNDFGRVFSEKTDWYATARGRFGMSTGPALLYFTAGAAWVHLSDGITIAGGGTDVAARTAGGWTVGGGTEVALNSRWSARFESLYMDVGHAQHRVGAVNADFKERFTVVRTGLTYQFGG